MMIQINTWLDTGANGAHPICVAPVLQNILSLLSHASLLLFRHFTHNGTLVIITEQTLVA